MKYCEMSIPQRWQWHAEVYALRRVLLGVPRDVHTRPPTQRACGTTRRELHAPKRHCALVSPSNPNAAKPTPLPTTPAAIRKRRTGGAAGTTRPPNEQAP